MIKYIVTWIIVSIQPTSCPDAGKTNEFGISYRGNIACAVYHVEEVKTKKEKVFENKKDAIDFKKRLENYIPVGFSSSTQDKIKDVKLDSINN